MSALGQKRTCAVQKGMSALPLKADICSAPAHVRFGPKRTLTGLFDHLVGTGEHRRWNCEAKRLSSLEIDYQLILGRRLHRKIGWLFTLEDAIDIAGRAPVLVNKIGSVGHQAAGDDEVAFEVDRWQFMSRR